MAKTILATNQKETPKADILDGNWYGQFQLHCRVYASDEVFLQANDPDDPDTGWINANLNGVDIKFSKVGAVLDVIRSQKTCITDCTQQMPAQKSL